MARRPDVANEEGREIVAATRSRPHGVAFLLWNVGAGSSALLTPLAKECQRKTVIARSNVLGEIDESRRTAVRSGPLVVFDELSRRLQRQREGLAP